MKAFQGHQVVVITGGSSGIGRACASAFARRGARLVLAARSGTALAEVAAACRAAGADVRVQPVDVTVPQTVAELARFAVAEFGRVDVWVHTAAVMVYGTFETVPAAVFDRVVQTDLLGAAAVARAALARFRAQGDGVLILTGSLLGRIAVPYMSAYVTSKWGLRGLARVLRQETRDAPGVHVCLVEPGSVDTPIYRSAATFTGWVGRPPPPVERPERVAAAVVRLAGRPRREVSVGVTNPFVRLGFQLLPGVYDHLVGPLMRRAGQSREPIAAHTGNVFAPLPAVDAPHGRWGRHWLRPATAAAATTVLVAAAAVTGRRLRTGRPGTAGAWSLKGRR